MNDNNTGTIVLGIIVVLIVLIGGYYLMNHDTGTTATVQTGSTAGSGTSY